MIVCAPYVLGLYFFLTPSLFLCLTLCIFSACTRVCRHTYIKQTDSGTVHTRYIFRKTHLLCQLSRVYTAHILFYCTVTAQQQQRSSCRRAAKQKRQRDAENVRAHSHTHVYKCIERLKQTHSQRPRSLRPLSTPTALPPPSLAVSVDDECV